MGDQLGDAELALWNHLYLEVSIIEVAENVTFDNMHYMSDKVKQVTRMAET